MRSTFQHRGDLYLSFGRNELSRGKAVNLALLIFLTLSANLLTTGSMVAERVVGSVDALFAQAKPPHFLQMHTGEYNLTALEQFAIEQPQIENWLIEEMVGYDSASLSWSRPGESGDLSASLIDNLFVTQNRAFDYLIDETGAIPHPSPGEVYLPIAYQQSYALQTGDELTIQTDNDPVSLKVAGFVRDSQMASSLSSATRILVNEEDFATLRQTGGDPEIIIEYRLDDPAAANAFQSSYEAAAALPKNGQAVTYDMIRLINSFSDGLSAAALILVSLLLISIALLSLRFVIRGSLEDQVRQLGAMKAIGLPSRSISALYLSRYSLLTLLGCLLGGVTAIPATAALTRNAAANYAVPEVGWISFVVPLSALTLCYVIVLLLCWRTLAAVRRVEVVTALVHGSLLTEKARARRSARAARRARRIPLDGGKLGVSRRLALIELWSAASQWALIAIVFALTALLMVLPTNLLATFTNPHFITYLGSPECDLRAELQFSDEVRATRTEVLRALRSDERITRIRSYSSVLYQVKGETGWQSQRVEVGEYTAGELSYLSGEAPIRGEIALSSANAADLGVAVGDRFPLRRNGVTTEVVVSGIYQDVTSGGRTAKLAGAGEAEAVGFTFLIDTADRIDPNALAQEYEAQFRQLTLLPMTEYLRQTLSYVTLALTSAAWLAVGFGLAIALLITCLFLKLRLIRERQTLGVLAALGFTRNEIIGQIRFRTLAAVALGSVLGTLLANAVGNPLISRLIGLTGLGISQLNLIPNLWLTGLGYPLALLGVGYLGAVALTRGIRHADASRWLNY